MDNLTESEQRRRELIVEIQSLYNTGKSIREIARITGKERKTIKKYVIGDPDFLCKSRKRSPLEAYIDQIVKSIQDGMTASAIAKELKDEGSQYTISNIRQYITSVAKRYGLEVSKYCRNSSNSEEDRVKNPKMDYITRKGIFNHLWMDIKLTEEHRQYLWEKNNVLAELDCCIREFRDIFIKKSMPYLYLFIDRYQNSEIKEIASFANGLSKDLSAVENAVASPLSNGFVEGTNSKVKTVKKAMYGRCGKMLLSAKLMYEPNTDY